MQKLSRRKYWWAAFGPFGRMIATTWTLWGVLMWLAPAQTQPKLTFWGIVSTLHMSASAWAIVALLVLLGGFMEGAFRLHRTNKEQMEAFLAAADPSPAFTAIQAAIRDAQSVVAEHYEGRQVTEDVRDNVFECGTAWWGIMESSVLPVLRPFDQARIRDEFKPAEWRKTSSPPDDVVRYVRFLRASMHTLTSISPDYAPQYNVPPNRLAAVKAQ